MFLHKHAVEYQGTRLASAASIHFPKGCCVSKPYYLAFEKVGSSLCEVLPQKRKQPQSPCERYTGKTRSSITIEVVKRNSIAKQLSLS